MGNPIQITSRRAFTFVEALFVVTVLAMLAGVLTPVVASHQKNERDQQRASDLAEVQQALEAYHAEHGVYPSTNGAWWGEAPRFGAKEAKGQRAYIPYLVPDYLTELPQDPDPALPEGERGYLYRSDGQNYKLMAHKTPESFSPTSPYYDPQRPTWAWQVSSPGGIDW